MFNQIPKRLRQYLNILLVQIYHLKIEYANRKRFTFMPWQFHTCIQNMFAKMWCNHFAEDVISWKSLLRDAQSINKLNQLIRRLSMSAFGLDKSQSARFQYTSFYLSTKYQNQASFVQITNLMKVIYFRQEKSKFLSKNRNFGKKSKFW